ncbi:hypothetical protein HNY73_011778 [Argiope bruennichi]|uniref:Uncharacterized protein n=1 Tax=Argiope bruennichi TaxID=94029 RepID=A0A8T0EUW7_ARGBR|nr:hypothetical protein HNY73_011778 [Argiope bruennichi]
MRYLQRFSDEEKRIKEMQCIKGRHNQNRMSVEYKMQFTIEQEKRDYETCGLDCSIQGDPNIKNQSIQNGADINTSKN